MELMMIFLVGYIVGQVVALKAVLLVLREASQDDQPAERPDQRW